MTESACSVAESANKLIIDSYRRSPYIFYVLFQYASFFYIDEEGEPISSRKPAKKRPYASALVPSNTYEAGNGLTTGLQKSRATQLKQT